MITTVTLNAALDKTYYLPQWVRGQVSRVQEVRLAPGGKGINVAKVLHALGSNALASGYVGGSNGRLISSLLSEQGMKHDFVVLEEESRMNLNIISTSDGCSTELLEPGPKVEPSSITQLTSKLRKLAERSKIMVFSGSLPPGTNTDLYFHLIEVVKLTGCRIFLDTSGAALLAGIKARPHFIKPNEQELCQILQQEQLDMEMVPDYIRTIMNQGIESLAVSLGEKGAVAGCNGQIFRIHAPKVCTVNPVGCGDAFVAGMTHAISQNMPFRQALKWAAACGAANATTAEAGRVSEADVQRLLEQVEVRCNQTVI